MSDKKADACIDKTHVLCPVTFVKAKAAGEDIDNGQTMEITLNDGEPVRNIPRDSQNKNPNFYSLEKNNDGNCTITVTKGGLLEI